MTRYERGMALLTEVVGEPALKTQTALRDIAPDLGILLAEYFGDLYSRPALDIKTRELLTVVALTVLGKTPQLKVHISAALNAGWSIDEIVESMIQMIGYAGFPPVLNGVEAVKDVLREMEGERENV